jgi:hypothetical protein
LAGLIAGARRRYSHHGRRAHRLRTLRRGLRPAVRAVRRLAHRRIRGHLSDGTCPRGYPMGGPLMTRPGGGSWSF